MKEVNQVVLVALLIALLIFGLAYEISTADYCLTQDKVTVQECLNAMDIK